MNGVADLKVYNLKLVACVFFSFFDCCMVVHTRSAGKKCEQERRIAVDGLICRIAPSAPVSTKAAIKRAALPKRFGSGALQLAAPPVATPISEPADSEDESADWLLGQYILLFLGDLEAYRS